MAKNITLVVMAAGMGSRFGGLKQMEPVGSNGEVILDFSVLDAVRAGFTKVVFVIKKAIETEFKELVGQRISKLVPVEYVFQEVTKLPEGFVCPEDREKPWGTAHAVWCCKDAIKEPFAVINADDFYGRTAFEQMASFLFNETEDYCMVGFRLVNTLTENGYVSRGCCKVEDGFLKSVTERTKIVDCRYTEDDGVTWTELSPKTIVSMNLWGFQQDIFEYIDRGFREFLRKQLTVPKSECYLPSVVSEAIESGRKKARVLIAEDKWYGVTYKEDKDIVVEAIADMVEKGLYN